MELVALDEFMTEIAMMKVAISVSNKVALLVNVCVCACMCAWCVCDSTIIIQCFPRPLL